MVETPNGRNSGGPIHCEFMTSHLRKCVAKHALTHEQALEVGPLAVKPCCISLNSNNDEGHKGQTAPHARVSQW